jgi:flagellar basal-body rod modification protein FlgD
MSTNAAPVTGPYAPAPAIPGPAPQTDLFSSDGFLRILAAQIRSQNPLEPLKDTEFIAQMAQFSQLEQVTNLAKDTKALAVGGALAQGAALIGKTVSYIPVGSVTPVTGVVEGLRVSGDGRSMALVVNNVSVDASLVSEVTG